MTTITVASIEWPKPGKKTGTILDNMGRKWVVYADKINAFQQFHTYDIVPKTIAFNGRTFETIESASPAPLGQGNQNGPASVRPVAQMSQPSNDDQRRMDIFVCGAFNNMMANPNFNVGEVNTQTVVELINILKQAWKQTLGPNAGLYTAGMAKPDPISSRNQDMNDDIPF